MKKLIFLFIFAVLRLAAQTQVRSYQSGIDVVLGGTLGTAWDFEEDYYLPTTYDRKSFWIQNTTTIGFAHNANNVTYKDTGNGFGPVVIGPLGDDGIANSGDEGQILIKFDMDENWSRRWGDGGGTETFYLFGGGSVPVNQVNNVSFTQIDSVGHTYGQNGYFFSTPVTLATATYPDGVTVSGHFGGRPGYSIGNYQDYWFRGVIDSVGDEWHDITAADYDILQIQHLSGYLEYTSTDGKVFHFVNNPLTACLNISVTGNAQFYTTPAKVYQQTKINDQTTYFLTKSGHVNFRLRDINGTNILYRINANTGALTNAGSSTKTFTETDFPNTGSTPNTLDYAVAGHSSVIKRRIIYNDPPFPSASESHGNILWGSTGNLYARMQQRITQAPWADIYSQTFTQAMYNSQDYFDPVMGTGLRIALERGIVCNGFCAMQTSQTTIPAGKSITYADYEKEMLLQGILNTDPVGVEINCSGTSMPFRDNYYRGYYDGRTWIDAANGYDRIIASYKYPTYANGMTAIQDRYIRDRMAERVYLSFFNLGAWSNQEYQFPGMWPIARNLSCIATILAMPSYSSTYYGTNGLDGNTTVYPKTPFPNSPLTWKKAFLDDDAPLVGFPDLNYRMGMNTDMFLANGDWNNKISYYQPANMGFIMFVMTNEIFINTGIRYPRYELSLVKAPLGTLYGNVEEPGPRTQAVLLSYNQRFSSPSVLGANWCWSLPDADPNSLANQAFITYQYGWVWCEGPGVVAGNPKANKAQP